MYYLSDTPRCHGTAAQPSREMAYDNVGEILGSTFPSSDHPVESVRLLGLNGGR
jgi:hypothetical protein